MTGATHTRSATFRVQVGSFSCLAIMDNTARYPLAMFLTNLPKERYEPWLQERGEDPEQVEMPYTCLFIDTGRERLLVDTGIGKDGVGFGLEPGRLIPLLRSEGIEPEQISAVVISHGHPDHIGGNLGENGGPAFPNARYVILRKEWDFWMSNPNLEELPAPPEFKHAMLASAQKNLRGVEARIELIEPDTQIVPGVTAIAAFGHSPGHMALEVSSAQQRLLFMADAIVHPLHIQFPETIGATDHVPREVAATRTRLLGKAAHERAIVSTTHFAFPGLGHVVPKGSSWEWRPIRADEIPG